MNINKTTLQAFRKDFDAAVKELENKYGIDISLKTIRADGQWNEAQAFTSKIEVLNRKSDGSSVTAEDQMLKKLEEAFVNYAWRYGLETQLGAKFMHNNAEHKVIGMKPRSKKTPIVVERLSDGARYKFPASFVQRGLGLEVTTADCYVY